MILKFGHTFHLVLPVILNGVNRERVNVEHLGNEVFVQEKVVLVGEFSAFMWRALSCLNVAYNLCF